MVILLTGASGFIGRRVAIALRDAGHRVIAGVRHAAAAPPRTEPLLMDFSRDLTVDSWTARVQGVDVVINAVGVFRQQGAHSFENLHARAPTALFAAAAQAGVRLVIQISALGADAAASSAFHRSKFAADEALRALPVRAVILQPSLVFGVDGASSGLFLMLASLPVIPLPRAAAAQVQPVHVDDLAEAVVRLVEGAMPARSKTIAVVGPEPLALRGYLAALRGLLGLRPARFFIVPDVLARLGQRVAGLGGEALDMLARGNAAPAEDFTRLLGRAPRGVDAFVPREYRPMLTVQARLAWTLPLLRVSLAAMWIVTGLLSLGLYPRADSYALLGATGVPPALQPAMLSGAALLDLLLGIGLLALRRRGLLYVAQIALMLGYMLIITWQLPAWWLHPFGPILKNLPLLAATLLLLVLEGRRR